VEPQALGRVSLAGIRRGHGHVSIIQFGKFKFSLVEDCKQKISLARVAMRKLPLAIGDTRLNK
jgi:hypothetical protein